MEQLERLGYVLPQDISVGIILNGLTSDFAGFVRNYNMYNMGKTIGQGKGKDKPVYILNPKNSKPSAKEHPTKDDACHYCKEVEHWKRNCPVYLAELVKRKKYAEFLEKKLLSQEVSGRAKELEEIQDKDTSPSEKTCKIPIEVEGFKPPQEEVVPVRRSAKTHRVPNCLCQNVEAEEHSLGDLNKPNNYKAAILDSESCCYEQTSFKKKTDMDGIVHTYQVHLVAKVYTQTYRVDYEDTFSPIADI
uniref:CCHC-type domain-containing protein n=1 Tax=Tanacetum cinerariifolium TaxID=118510 RepID=A0A6L2K9E4_TANCI|nr:hypothetical protein [Tanacetum cinerariifolium]